MLFNAGMTLQNYNGTMAVPKSTPKCFIYFWNLAYCRLNTISTYDNFATEANSIYVDHKDIVFQTYTKSEMEGKCCNKVTTKVLSLLNEECSKG